jgi:hypothetical protein
MAAMLSFFASRSRNVSRSAFRGAAVSLSAIATACAAIAGCGDDGAAGGGGAGAGGTGGSGAGAPTLPELAEGWNELTPEGTICARGAPYSFWVRPGTTNKVIIDFIGGGACWDDLTCSVADAIFSDDVEDVRQAVASAAPVGIYDHGRADNPFADYYHVVIPYCTGDVHWGDAVQTYGSGASEVTINHKGAVNTRAVLSWIYESFSEPEQIFVTGCSAGSYGSILWSAHIMDHYKTSRVYQFGDSGAGIITDDFFQNSFPSWNAQQAFPSFIPALDPAQVDIQSMALPDLYAGIANHFPDRRLSQYNTMFDDNQLFYYEAMGGTGGAPMWSQLMQASIAEIESRAPNFAAFTAPGEQHCIIPFANYYTVNANGTKLVDWLRTMIDDGPLESVKCQGAECDADTP